MYDIYVFVRATHINAAGIIHTAVQTVSRFKCELQRIGFRKTVEVLYNHRLLYLVYNGYRWYYL